MPAMTNEIEIFVRTGNPDPVEEFLFSRDFCFQYIKDFAAPHPAGRISGEELKTVNDLLMASSAKILIVINEEEILTPPWAFHELSRILMSSSWAALSPVYNAGKLPSQAGCIPSPYHNVRNFVEVADILRKSPHPEIHSIDPAAEWPCVAVRRESLEKAPSDEELSSLWSRWAAEGKVGQVDWLLVHRFMNYYASRREDLVGLIPASAKRILDVGCAYGYLGKYLKTLRPCHLTGVELNSHMAASAAQDYDEVISRPVEQAVFSRDFDAIVCGDVIEHLRNPEEVLKRLRDSLASGGVLIGSVPNAGHWSIVMDLAGGRFEMIPAGMLCVTHIRFFTEEEIRNLLAKVGLQIEIMERVQTTPTPQGERFIQTLVSAKLGNEESLRTESLRFRAVKG